MESDRLGLAVDKVVKTELRELDRDSGEGGSKVLGRNSKDDRDKDNLLGQGDGWRQQTQRNLESGQGPAGTKELRGWKGPAREGGLQMGLGHPD